MFKLSSKSVAIITGIAMAMSAMLAIGNSATNAHATTAATCVDGSKQSNLTATWVTNGNVTVKTLKDKLLCNDVTVFFSSYTMPDNYNGQGFNNNPTAVPQDVYKSVSATMKKGTNGASNLKVQLPEACKNIQVDLYYAPEIKHVDVYGHGAQYITGKMLQKTVKDCTPETPVTPEVPIVPVPEAQTPETPTPVVMVPTAAPVELPHTGSALDLSIAFATIIGSVTYAATLAITKRQ